MKPTEGYYQPELLLICSEANKEYEEGESPASILSWFIEGKTSCLAVSANFSFSFIRISVHSSVLLLELTPQTSCVIK